MTKDLALLSAPVLITESADEFARFHDAVKHELRPQKAIECFLVDDITKVMWEIRRHRRAKTILINSASRPALQNLLQLVCRGPRPTGPYELEERAQKLAHKWFGGDERAKEEVLQKFAYFKLDESAIEAEAMRIVAPDLERFDRLLASLEWRLSKAMRLIAELRGGFGRQLRASAERVIDGEVLALDHAAKRPPPAAA